MPIQIPIGSETELEGIVDLITMEEWVWEGEDLGASWDRRPVRDSLKDKAEELLPAVNIELQMANNE